MSDIATDVFVCVECGQTVERIIPRAKAEPALCATCTVVPGWHGVPALARLLGGPDFEMKPSAGMPRKCRVCGCTDTSACMTEDGPCFWLEEDLCSAHIDEEDGDV